LVLNYPVVDAVIVFQFSVINDIFPFFRVGKNKLRVLLTIGYSKGSLNVNVAAVNRNENCSCFVLGLVVKFALSRVNVHSLGLSSFRISAPQVKVYKSQEYKAIKFVEGYNIACIEVVIASKAETSDKLSKRHLLVKKSIVETVLLMLAFVVDDNYSLEPLVHLSV
jgi:hypothetical protein